MRQDYTMYGDLEFFVKNDFTELAFELQLKIKHNGKPTPKGTYVMTNCISDFVNIHFPPRALSNKHKSTENPVMKHYLTSVGSCRL